MKVQFLLNDKWEKFLLEFHRTAVEVVDWDHMSWQAIEGRSNKWNVDNRKKDYFPEMKSILTGEETYTKILIKMSSIINIKKMFSLEVAGWRVVQSTSILHWYHTDRVLSMDSQYIRQHFSLADNQPTTLLDFRSRRALFCASVHRTTVEWRSKKNETQLIIIPHVFNLWLLKSCVKK